ncbi:hypothetical protein EI555_015076 [Monodon monoceros]|uniref:Uncharacterized protein n=1 Tax=Monodon monoceros TaxID=40151 RepID=A0A4U1EEN5_MONMO|nr:hypothetical protein EI555_015076 [Monodon monoceros]
MFGTQARPTPGQKKGGGGQSSSRGRYEDTQGDAQTLCSLPGREPPGWEAGWAWGRVPSCPQWPVGCSILAPAIEVEERPRTQWLRTAACSWRDVCAGGRKVASGT